jgi:hypothetical protein
MELCVIITPPGGGGHCGAAGNWCACVCVFFVWSFGVCLLVCTCKVSSFADAEEMCHAKIGSTKSDMRSITCTCFVCLLGLQLQVLW